VGHRADVAGAQPSLCRRLARGVAPYPIWLFPRLVARNFQKRSTHDGHVERWRFVQRRRETRVRVEGPLVFNAIDLILDSAPDGLGLAYLPLDQVQKHLKDSRLRRVLGNWTPPIPGYHLYYPSRRQSSPAFRLLLEALRYRPAVGR
jgi:DNA-binding transcriptional LysR family regulator